MPSAGTNERPTSRKCFLLRAKFPNAIAVGSGFGSSRFSKVKVYPLQHFQSRPVSGLDVDGQRVNQAGSRDFEFPLSTRRLYCYAQQPPNDGCKKEQNDVYQPYKRDCHGGDAEALQGILPTIWELSV